MMRKENEEEKKRESNDSQKMRKRAWSHILLVRSASGFMGKNIKENYATDGNEGRGKGLSLVLGMDKKAVERFKDDHHMMRAIGNINNFQQNTI